MFILSELIDLTNLTNACIVTSQNVTDKTGNIEINNVLYRRRKMCEPIKNMEIIFLKKQRPYLEAIPPLFSCTGTCLRRT